MTKICFAAPEGTIYVRIDGSIDPQTAPISSLDNATYTFTGDIFNDSIVIERDNIVVDGAGYIIEGTRFGYGINDYGITLVESTNVTIKNMTIKAFGQGIQLAYSSNNTLTGNSITTNKDGPGYGIALSSSPSNIICGNNITNNKGGGITLYNSTDNSISRNNITNNGFGIDLEPHSDNNTICGNDITNNWRGIWLASSFNTFYHNNFMNNDTQVSSLGFTNFWDNGFEGNYWSDYKGADENQDGIGDTPYIISENNTDHYPLMGTFQSFNVSITPQSFGVVSVISNFTISDLGLYEWLTTPNQYLQAGQLFLRLAPVQEQNLTAGFCRMTLPNNVLNTSDYIVLINMTPASVNRLTISNNTYTTLYFTFNISTNEIIIVPEFPSFLVLPLFMIATLLVMIVYGRKHPT